MTIVSDKPDLSEDAPQGAMTRQAPAAVKTRRGALAETGSPTVRPPAAAHLSDEQVAELGRELDAIKDDILAKRGAIRRRLYPPHDQDPARTGDFRPRHAAGQQAQGGLGCRDHPAQLRQDPRKHGARAQHPARPVGLDAGPGHPLHHLGMGLRHPGARLAAHPQRSAPPLDQRRRQGQRRRIQPAADGRGPGVEALQPGQPAVQRPLGPGLRVGHRDLRSRARTTTRRGTSPRKPSSRTSRPSASRRSPSSPRTTPPPPPSPC